MHSCEVPMLKKEQSAELSFLQLPSRLFYFCEIIKLNNED